MTVLDLDLGNFQMFKVRMHGVYLSISVLVLVFGFVFLKALSVAVV